MITKLINISNHKKKIIQFGLDCFLIYFAFFLSISASKEYLYNIFSENEAVLFFSVPFIVWPLFISMGLYKSIIRFIDTEIIWKVIEVSTSFMLIFYILLEILNINSIPLISFFTGWILIITFLSGNRLFASWIIRQSLNYHGKGYKKKNVLIYGAGNAGQQLNFILKNSTKYIVTGFIDDSKNLQGRQIDKKNIYKPANIKEIVKKFGIEEIFLSIPSLLVSRRLEILKTLNLLELPIRILPSLEELSGEKISDKNLRKINILDLLGRDPVTPDIKLLRKNTSDKVVMITGAGGSIGSEICRQVALYSPKKIIMYELNELALYSIDHELEKNSVDRAAILGNVSDKERLIDTIEKFGVSTIYHAAAYKHVPMVETNITQGINNNIFGTLSVVEASIKTQIENFVLISTDKAVKPSSIMGVTKRFSELIVQSYSASAKNTNFSIVRFGNVLNSSGSVIPLFREQINNGGPVTVTHKDITRFFMTIPEAVELVIQAGAIGSNGDIFVLNMGEPVLIDDLARKMINLSGFSIKDEAYPEGDIEIKYIGLRPGEKLYEELFYSDNNSPTINPLIFKSLEQKIRLEIIEKALQELHFAVLTKNFNKIRSIFFEVVPDLQPDSEMIDLLMEKE